MLSSQGNTAWKYKANQERAVLEMADATVIVVAVAVGCHWHWWYCLATLDVYIIAFCTWPWYTESTSNRKEIYRNNRSSQCHCPCHNGCHCHCCQLHCPCCHKEYDHNALNQLLTLNTFTWQPALWIGRASVDELGEKESTCNLNGTPLSPPTIQSIYYYCSYLLTQSEVFTGESQTDLNLAILMDS